MIQLEAVGNRVVVKQDDAESRSRGGVHLPDAGRRKPLRGRVVATGPGRTTDDGVLLPTGVQVGDLVAYGWHDTGDEFQVDGETYRAFDAGTILCLLVEEPARGRKT